VFICLTRDMELRVLYTAITRCEYIDQLYYYEGDHSDFSDMVEADEDEDDDEYDEDVTEALAVVSAAVQTSLRAAWRATVSRQ
jgi:ATP-dependent exoDNAse (exonuclease V) alpha subunit